MEAHYSFSTPIVDSEGSNSISPAPGDMYREVARYEDAKVALWLDEGIGKVVIELEG